MLSDLSSDEIIRQSLGRRVQAHRLFKNQDQATFAYEAGVSASTLYRLEKGETVSIDAYIRVLRVLGLLSRLDDLIPEVALSPMQQLREKRARTRQRATGKRKRSPQARQWQGFGVQVSFDENSGDA